MKTEFNIVETTAEHCRGYKRSTKGREIVGQMEALNASEALQEWLSDLSDTYGITKTGTGFCMDSDTERIVWEPGDSTAYFGDYTISAEETL